MPDGNMRRPKQLPEQILVRKTAILGAGISGSDITTGVGETPTPGTEGGGTDPGPVTPAPSDFKKPSTPTLTGSVQGIRVRWDGLNSDSNLWPYDTSWIEVHMSTSGATFTPDSTTLIGRLDYPGEHYAGGLTAGTTYYFRFRGADAAGNYTEASTAASGQTGLTTENDYGLGTIGAGAVSFNARQIGGITTTVGTTAPTSPVTGDIWLDSSSGTSIIHKRWNGSAWVTQAWGSDSLSANCITATQIAAGAVTAGAILAGEVTAEKIKGDAIDGKTITGATIRTSAGTGARVVLDASGLRGFNASNQETININASTGAVTISGYATSGDISGFITAGQVNGNVTSINGSAITSGTITGRTVQSSSGTSRIVLNNADTLDFYSSNVKRGDLYGVTVSGLNGIGVTGALDVSSTIFGQALNISGSTVDMLGVYNNNTTGLAPVGITTDGRLRRNGTSSQSIKYDIATLAGTLSDSVDTDRLCEVATVDPASVLDVAVVEFSVIDDGLPTERRLLGFIADDVADKLPIAVLRDADDAPAGVIDQAMVAALLAVVKQQQAQIADLTTRLDALEA